MIDALRALARLLHEGVAVGAYQPTVLGRTWRRVCYEMNSDLAGPPVCQRQEWEGPLEPSWALAAARAAQDLRTGPETELIARLDTPSLVARFGSFESLLLALAAYMLDNPAVTPEALAVLLETPTPERRDQWDQQIGLVGLHVSGEPLCFDALGYSFRLRSPTREDLEFTVSEWVYQSFPQDIPTALLETDCEGQSDDLSEVLEKVLLGIRLRWTCGADWFYRRARWFDPLTSVEKWHLPTFRPPSEPNQVVQINTHCAMNPGQFVGALAGLRADERDHLRIALEAYSEYLFHHRRVPQARIAQAVMGLEALLLGEDENQELSYKLRNRGAVLLGAVGFDPVPCADEIRRAYGYRSKYVHGSVKIPARQEDAVALATEVGGYLRTLIVFFAISAPVAKKRLIELCDRALIDPSGRRELAQQAQEARRLLDTE
ncbi:MAG: hypothetical protein ACYC1C_02540 [Chloroflexota bacterium]